MFDQELFNDARREFLSHLRYAQGHRQTTCYAYNSDLGIWGAWLIEAGKDWQTVKYPDVEQFAAWQLRDRGISPAIVNRRLSALSTFYRWLMRGGLVEQDPVALAQKPKRPLRIDGEGGGEVVSRIGWKDTTCIQSVAEALPVDLKTRRGGTWMCRRGRVPLTPYRDVPVPPRWGGSPIRLNIDI